MVGLVGLLTFGVVVVDLDVSRAELCLGSKVLYSKEECNDFPRSVHSVRVQVKEIRRS